MPANPDHLSDRDRTSKISQRDLIARIQSEFLGDKFSEEDFLGIDNDDYKLNGQWYPGTETLTSGFRFYPEKLKELVRDGLLEMDERNNKYKLTEKARKLIDS